MPTRKKGEIQNDSMKIGQIEMFMNIVLFLIDSYRIVVDHCPYYHCLVGMAFSFSVNVVNTVAGNFLAAFAFAVVVVVSSSFDFSTIAKYSKVNIVQKVQNHVCSFKSVRLY